MRDASRLGKATQLKHQIPSTNTQGSSKVQIPKRRRSDVSDGHILGRWLAAILPIGARGLISTWRSHIGYWCLRDSLGFGVWDLGFSHATAGDPLALYCAPSTVRGRAGG